MFRVSLLFLGQRAIAQRGGGRRRAAQRREAGHDKSDSINARPSMLRSTKRLQTQRRPAASIPPNVAVETIEYLPSAFPNPWQYDTQALIAELDRARALVLPIPLHNGTFGPVNTATATLRELRERIRWLAGAVAGQQREWQKKADRGLERQATTEAQAKSARFAR